MALFQEQLRWIKVVSAEVILLLAQRINNQSLFNINSLKLIAPIKGIDP